MCGLEVRHLRAGVMTRVRTRVLERHAWLGVWCQLIIIKVVGENGIGSWWALGGLDYGQDLLLR